MDNRPNAHFNDEDSNTSANPAFVDIAKVRMSRRGWLQGAASVGLASSATLAASNAQAAPMKQLGFKAVGKSLADTVVVPEGYTPTDWLRTLCERVELALGKKKSAKIK